MTRARDNSFNPFNNQAAGKNFFINGAMDIWQRGTSPTITQDTNVLTADRMYTYRGGIVNVSVTRQTSDLEGFQYFARIKRTTGDTSTSNIHIGTNMETLNVIPLRNKIVTLSFWARRGSDNIGSSNILSAYLGSSTDIDAQWINPAGQTQIFQGAPVLTTSWQRFSFTGVVPSNANSLRTVLYYTPTSTAAGANEYYDVTGIQLELGPNATQFSRAGGTIGGELALCQRYYWSIADISLAAHGARIADTDGIRAQAFNLSQTMRSIPTVSFEDAQGTSGAVSIRIFSTGLHTHGVTSFAMNVNTQKVVNVQKYPYGVSGITNGQPCQVDIYNLKFNSEL